MKKILFVLCLSLFILGSHAQNTTNKVIDNVSSGVSAVHEDTKNAISTLHEDASKIVETVYTDSKSVIGVIYDDANKVVKYAIPKLENALVVLAQTLRTTVAEVYEAMIRKQIAVAISDLCYGLFGFFFLFLAYRITQLPESKLYGNSYSPVNRSWKNEWIAGVLLAVSASFVLLIAFMVHFQEMILGFYAPKYGAIREIVAMVDTLLK